MISTEEGGQPDKHSGSKVSYLCWLFNREDGEIDRYNGDHWLINLPGRKHPHQEESCSADQQKPLLQQAAEQEERNRQSGKLKYRLRDPQRHDSVIPEYLEPKGTPVVPAGVVTLKVSDRNVTQSGANRPVPQEPFVPIIESGVTLQQEGQQHQGRGECGEV